MTEPRRVDSESARATADRDSRAEALLVDGLDRYFAGDFENAIHLWTRVLFLDRHHARARAYIERARSAQGERLRRADEMLQATETLIADGDVDRARSVLTQASRIGADDEQVAHLWSDLERRARARAPRGPIVAPDRGLASAWPNRRAVLGGAARLIVMALVGAFAVSAALSPVVREWWGGPTAATENVVLEAPLTPKTLSPDDVALLRARTFRARGRLAEALRALDAVSTAEARRVADTMRVEMQNTLLATVPGVPVAEPRTGVERP